MHRIRRLPQGCARSIFCLSTSPVFAVPVPTSINYGQVASAYDNSRCVEPAIAVALIEGLRSIGVRSILEIGAGTGNYTGALKASGFSVTALDRSPAMVEI